MAESVLFSIAGSVAAQAIGSLGSPVLKELGMLWGLKGELQKLQDTVSAIHAKLLDAEEKQAAGDNAVRLWLSRLEDVVYEADDLLDDFNTEGLLREMMTRDKKAKKVRLFFPKSNKLYYGLKMAHKIKAIREKLGAIKDDKEFLLLENRTEEKTGVSSSEGRDSHSFVLAEEVFGREDDKQKLIGLLLRESNLRDNVAILSIVGIGGLGKTTLAQLLFNDEKVKKHFELKMWVCVSDNFDVREIVKKMIESATDKKPGDVGMDNLVREVGKVIGGKKYFLVLDDLWNEDIKKWDDLEKLLLCGARGSRVLVTTRSGTVANISCSGEPYFLKGLEKPESWSLFKHMAFRNGEESESPTIIETGTKILQECQGVPLVIRTIGRLLHSRHSEKEWSDFLNKELPRVKGKDILETLKLSYNHLPPHLKHCFAYCSIFPKDCIIKKSILINLWIAQGFIIKPTGQNQCLEDIASDYFMKLLWRSFFQEARTDEFGDIGYCKMHDFMHDLAVKVSGSSFTIFDFENKLLDESKTRHVAIGDVDFLSAAPTLFSKASTMRTLVFLSERKTSSFTQSTLNAIFSSLKLLRTLDLEYSGIDVVPSSVSKLKHLRYLDLSGNYEIKKLPYLITRLQNLHTLRLILCRDLEELPRDIKNLINLRHLEIDGCDALTCMPRGLGQLTNLMTLSLFVVYSGGGVAGNSNGGLDELNGLNSLRGKLEIRGLDHGKDVASEYKAANLKNKQHLHNLVLGWTYNFGENIVLDDEMQLEVLEPHLNLKDLSLENYGGVRLPNWLSLLSNLVSVRLDCCKNLTYLPSLSQLTSLNCLTLEGLDDLEYILDSNMDVSATSSIPIAYFPSLKEMNILFCPKLKGWCRRMDSLETMTVTWMEDYPLLPSFPLLSELYIDGCPLLTSMPTFPHLEQLLYLKNACWKPLQQTIKMNVAELESRSPTLVVSSPTPLSKLKSLTLDVIEDLRSLPQEGLQDLLSLQDLSIYSCKKLETLSRGIQHLTALQTLQLGNCIELDLGKDDDWMQCQGLKSLHTLRISSLPKLVSLPSGFQHLTTLRAFEISACDSLTAIPDWIQKWTSLEEFTIWRCTSLSSLPEGMRRLTSLRKLSIIQCPIILQRCERDKGEDWPQIAHIPDRFLSLF